MKKSIAYLLFIIIFPNGVRISDFFFLKKIQHFTQQHPEMSAGLNPFHIAWWHLRFDIYALLFSVLIYACMQPEDAKYKKYTRFFACVAFGMIAGNTWDRWATNTRQFDPTADLTSIVFILLFEYRKEIKNFFIKTTYGK